MRKYIDGSATITVAFEENITKIVNSKATK